MERAESWKNCNQEISEESLPSRVIKTSLIVPLWFTGFLGLSRICMSPSS